MDLPIFNDSAHDLQLGLEPEGDCITLSPGDRCVIRFIAEPGVFGIVDLDITYRDRDISVCGMVPKEVFLDGKKIRT